MHRFVRSALLAFLLLPVLAGTAAAKDNAQAELDAAIPRDADPGTQIDVGFRAWVPDGGTDWPFSGLAVFIRLTSPDGRSSTEASARQDRSVPGRYSATVVIPDGGVGLVEVGLFGESCVNDICTRSDLMFALPEEQRVPRAAVHPVTVAAAAGAALVAGIGILRRVRTTHGPAGVAAPAHAGLRRGS